MATEGNIGFAKLPQQTNGGIMLREPPLSMAALLISAQQQQLQQVQHNSSVSAASGQPPQPASQNSDYSSHLSLHQSQAPVVQPGLPVTGGSGSISGPSSVSQPHVLPQASTGGVPTNPDGFTLKLSNLPQDLTKREAHLIFALVINDVILIDFDGYLNVVAHFKTLNTCLTTGKLLEGKLLFGSDSLPLKVEYDNNNNNNNNTNSNNNNSNTSNNGGNNAFPSIGQFNSLRISTSGMPQQPLAPPLADYQKRQSMGSQRLRFLFSDPFSAAPPPGATTQLASGGPASTTDPRIDLSDLSGKSLLLMELQNDAREYDQLVRDPWKNTSISGSTPQTPGAGATGPFDWNQQSTVGAAAAAGANDRRRASSAFFNSSSGTNLHNLIPSATQTHPILTLGFTTHPGLPNTIGLGSQANTVTPQASQGLQKLPSDNTNPIQVQTQAQQTQSTQQASNQGGIQKPQQTLLQPGQPGQGQPQNSLVNPQQVQNSTSGTNSVQTSPPSTAQGLTIANNNNNNSNNNSNGNLVSGSTSAASNGPSASASSTGNSSSSSSGAVVGSSTRKDVPDLSLLARVPPPANPADQNPPCNTLYVGNLPPDATEAELRALFSPQKGFRRLSFRTKILLLLNPNLNNHNHGPMCFVEFEDVAHATRALAELYGSALPRPGGTSGKGGIRLSFSKNPLGVRGPGNPRRTLNTQALNGTLNQVQQGSLTSQSQPLGTQSNGINYGYQSYHKA